ncbi:MAG: hypothetical protein HYV78_00395 [Candidatus Wildermuthbacteria bacterium]|nr:hypothetical protein [Candidatus Wildermuthbacteria bacterium]
MLGRDLVRRLRGEGEEENPLALIGITPEILGLGLSDGDLYDHCRQIARNLMAKAHPDLRGGEAAANTLRFSKALELLKNRARFDEALREFRQGYVFVRREERSLRSQVAELTLRIGGLEQRLRSKEEEVARAEEIARRYDAWARWFLEAVATQFAGSRQEEFQVAHRDARLFAIRLEAEIAPPPIERLRKEVLRFQEGTKSRAAAEGRSLSAGELIHLRMLVEKARLHAIPAKSLLEAAGETRSIQWDLACFMKKNFPLADGGGTVAIAGEPHPKWIGGGMLELYREALRRIAVCLGDRHVTKLTIAPEEVEILAGWLGNMGTVPHGEKLFALGTVSLDVAAGVFQNKTAHSLFAATDARERALLLGLSPLLYPGRALIACRQTTFVMPGEERKFSFRSPFYFPYVILGVKRK